MSCILTPDPKPFRFKQFEIHQHETAMKVGTDGVLLGAWTTASNCKNILDIGSGTGLLSLMLAQKSEATIYAVEIDPKAAAQATFNFQLSKWKDRIKIQPLSIQDFHRETQKKFDLIISNPPYFPKQAKETSRSRARSQLSLELNELAAISSDLLSENGQLSLILPLEVLDHFIACCNSCSLYLEKKCLVKGNTSSKPKRAMLSFSKKPTKILESELTIEKDQRHDYTDEYLELVAPYLL